MGDITLDGAIALLASEKLRERSDGLAGLSCTYTGFPDCAVLTQTRSKAYTPEE